MKERIERWYRLGLWTAEMVQVAAEKGILSTADAEEIMEECVE